MDERPRLSSIEPMVASTKLERGDYLRRGAACGMVVVAFLFLLAAAEVAWSIRTVSHFPDAVFALFAAMCIGVPVSVGVRAVRRAGWDILVLLSLIVPVMVWLVVAIVLAVAGALDGKNVF